MEVLFTVLVAVGLGVLWVVVLRGRSGRTHVPGAPREVDRVLADYRKARWQAVADAAPALLARPSDGGDKAWRPRLELAYGHSLVELDQPDEAVPHLERGLLLQSAVRRSASGSDVPPSADIVFRHLLGWAYAQTGRTSQARREYRRVLDAPDLDAATRAKVEASLDALP